VSRANPDGRRPMWRQVVRAAWRSRVADMNKVEIGGREPVLPLLGVHGGEARPPAVMSSRSRQGPRGYPRQPKPASTGRSRGKQLERVQRSPRQVGQGRVGGSDAVSRAGGRAALPTAGEGEPRAPTRVSPPRATKSNPARRGSSTPEQRGRQSRGNTRGLPCGIVDSREGGGAARAPVRVATANSDDQARA
jgi:hypothetical protein